MVKACINGGLLDSVPFDMGRQRGGNPVNSNHAITTHIPHLLLWGLPLAVGLFINAIIVFPSQAQTFWGLTHIRQEVFKGPPPVANGNSAINVTVRFPAIMIGGAREHRLPNAVSASFISSDGGSMGSRNQRGDFCFVTPTRRRIAPSERIIEHRKDFAALTTADRCGSLHGFEGDVRRVGDYFKSSVCLTDNGYFGRHNDDKGIVVISCGPRRQPGLTATILECREES